MRAIHLVRLDKVRPALVLTRPTVSTRLAQLTVAPITSRVRGLNVEVPVDARNGLHQPSVVNLDGIQTVPRRIVLERIGYFFEEQEPELARALAYALDLDVDIP